MENPGVDLGHHSFLDTDILFGGKGKRKHVPNAVFPTDTDPATEIEHGKLVPQERVQNSSATTADFAQVTVSRIQDGNEAVMLVPKDTGRTRALLTNYGLVDVMIGRLSSGLSSGNGYVLKAGTASLPGQSVELYNQIELFGIVIPAAAAFSTASIGVIIERNN